MLNNVVSKFTVLDSFYTTFNVDTRDDYIYDSQR